MENILGKRIKTLREEKDLSQLDFAKILNINNSTLSQYEAGNRIPSDDIKIKIADYFNVSVDYLLGRNDTLENNSVPLLGTIRAGIPLLAEDNWVEEIEVPSNLQADFALRVTGDSMSWAGIHDGDIAVLQKIDIASHGMIVAAGVENATWEATLKFYVHENGKPMLRAANPSYEDIIITPEHRIIGHVVSIQKEPPTLQNYKDILISREIMDEHWENTIEKATQKGMDGEKVAKLIELFADMAKNF
jgi:repressor LexA